MNTASKSDVSNSSNSFDAFEATYGPEMIPRYVATKLQRMYMGTAPTLAQVEAAYGEGNYRIWVSSMVEAILDFAGLSGRFDISQMNLIADMIRCRYPALKVTELMHFVYLCQSGEYEGFYGNPNGRTLLAQLAQYVRVDRERILAGYMRATRSEALQEGGRGRAELTEEEKAVVGAVIAELSSPEYQERYGAWRREPWGTDICRAYFVDRTLATFPGDMTYDQRRRWAESRY